MHKEVNEWQKLWWNQSLLLANAVAIIDADINDVKPLAKKDKKTKDGVVWLWHLLVNLHI